MSTATTASASIRTPDQRLRVFVSSTLQELAPRARGRARRDRAHLRLTPVMFELGARAASAARPVSRVPRAERRLRRHLLAALRLGRARRDDLGPRGRVRPRRIDAEAHLHQERRHAVKTGSKELIRRIQGEDTVGYQPFSDCRGAEAADRQTTSPHAHRALHLAATVPSRSRRVAELRRASLPPAERGELMDEPAARVVDAAAADARYRLITLTGPGEPARRAWRSSWPTPSAPRSPTVLLCRRSTTCAPARASCPPSPPRSSMPVPTERRSPAKRLARASCGPRRALLVLDNFEQVLEARSRRRRIARRLSAPEAPRHRAGNRCASVPSASSRSAARPRLETDGPITPAMRLFEQRAREVRPDFAIDDQNRAAVAEICRRPRCAAARDRVAAARVRVLSPQAMVPASTSRSRCSRAVKPRSPERQQTLRGALDWSLDLLSPTSACSSAAWDLRWQFSRRGGRAPSSATPRSKLSRARPRSWRSRCWCVANWASRRASRCSRRCASSHASAWSWPVKSATRACDTPRGSCSCLPTNAARSATPRSAIARTKSSRSRSRTSGAAFAFLSGTDGDREKAWEFLCELGWVRQHEFRGAEVRVAYDALRCGGVAEIP